MEGNGNAPVTREDLQEFKRELVSQIGETMDTRFHQIDEHSSLNTFTIPKPGG